MRGLVALLISSFWLLPSAAVAQTPVSCGSPAALQSAVDAALPGDTLLVSGVCNENVVVGADTFRVTLDGQGTATINGPDATVATVLVVGKGITIRGFTITGGRQGSLNGNSGATSFPSDCVNSLIP